MNLVTVVPSGTCTHTSGAGPHWWKVDLLESNQISAVVIHNRVDCCQDRIDGVKVSSFIFVRF